MYLAVQPRAQSAIFAAVYTERILYGAGYGWMAAWLSEDSLRSPDGSVSSNAIEGAKGLVGLIEGYTGEVTRSRSQSHPHPQEPSPLTLTSHPQPSP